MKAEDSYPTGDLGSDRRSVESQDRWLVIVASGWQEERAFAQVPHQHGRGQLLCSERGLLTVGVEEAVWTVPPRHSVWLPPKQIHWARSHGAFEGWLAYVAEPACRTLPSQPRIIATSNLLREAALRVSQWSETPKDARCLRIAKVVVDEIGASPVDAFGIPMPRDGPAQRVAARLLATPTDDRGLEAWAHTEAVSPRTLSRRFHDETGFSFTQWRQRARLLRALELLSTDQPVTTIAADLGYASASAFISHFRRTFGQSPARYRTQL